MGVHLQRVPSKYKMWAKTNEVLHTIGATEKSDFKSGLKLVWTFENLNFKNRTVK